MTSKILTQNQKDTLANYIHLNENNLKAITADQLKNPENQLTMINLINYRYLLANLHCALLMIQKEKTQTLIDELNSAYESL